MRNLLFIIFILIGSVLSAQQHSDSNRFDETEQELIEEDVNSGPGDECEGCDLEGNDPLPLPVDGYIPLLLISAFGIIIYTKKKKSKTI